MSSSSPQPPQAEVALSDASHDDSCTSSGHSSTDSEADTTTATTPSGSATSPEVEIGGPPWVIASPGGDQGFYQLTAHMLKLFTHQHRLFAYGFYVQWKWARLLRFDRSGVLVSEPFDWTETTSPLHDFVWKIAHMTLEELGYDPTVQVASELEIDLLRSKMGDELKTLPAEVQRYVLNAFLSTATRQQEATTSDAGDSTTKLKKAAKAKPVVSSDEIPIYDSLAPSTPSTLPSTSSASVSGEREFLVSHPHFTAGSLIGRCTRGYVAFDLKTETFCFLKDSWRPLVPGRSRPEHLVYERLRGHGVFSIASLMCGGDVGGPRAQVTTIQDDIPAEKKPIARVHYRIVIEEIGVPITEFQNFAELAAVFGHALIAHMAAYEEAGILHCDISVGNILIDPESRCGFLIDWDLSRLVSELGHGPMEPDRIGTWQFRSALSLRYPRKPYRRADDVESFVHAFRYMVLRFHPTDLEGLREHVQGYFEHSSKVGNFRLGGQKKLDYFNSEKPSFVVVNNPNLQALLASIAYHCYHGFYERVDTDLMKRKYGIPNDTTAEVSKQQSTLTSSTTLNTSAVLNVPAKYRSRVSRFDGSSFSLQSHVVLVDACDITEGFLSTQDHLLALFLNFQGNARDKHQDQFLLRAAEEPAKVVSNAPAQGISQMSTTQTRDSTQDPSGSGHVASVSAPSTAATSPPVSPPALDSPPPVSSPALNSPMASLSFDDPSSARPALSSDAQTRRKRKQKQQDAGQADKAAVADSNDGTGVGLSPSKQEPKRSRKRRS
ncbi:hypothetical protein V8D89_004992 [Ganoderma adspersum]